MPTSSLPRDNAKPNSRPLRRPSPMLQGRRRVSHASLPILSASDLSLENLYPGIREDALAYFTRNKIKWHHAIDGRPSNHLCRSQVACVNFLFPLAANPSALKQVLSTVVPDAREISPIEDGQYVSFEYIGEHNYLGERMPGRATRSRGANATSADAAVLYRKADGSTHLCLIEWKYTEAYGPGYLRYSDSGTDRFRIYAAHLESPTSPIRLPRSISFDGALPRPVRSTNEATAPCPCDRDNSRERRPVGHTRPHLTKSE